MTVISETWSVFKSKKNKSWNAFKTEDEIERRKMMELPEATAVPGPANPLILRSYLGLVGSGLLGVCDTTLLCVTSA